MPLDEKTTEALSKALFELEDEQYIVDNTQLRSKSAGIRFRSSPAMDDFDNRKGFLVKFGKIVEGIHFPEGWLLVDGFGKRRFLPMQIEGMRVLLPVKVGLGSSGHCSDPENEAPEEEVQKPPERELTAGELDLLQVVGAPVLQQQDLVDGLVWLRWLLQTVGSSVNVQGSDGLTPLMLAARRGNLDFCVALVRFGADTSLRSREGKLPAEYATWVPCRALLHALDGSTPSSEELQHALEKLQPSLRKDAGELIQSAAARAQDRTPGGTGAREPASQAPGQTVPEKPKRRAGARFRVIVSEVGVYDSPSTSAEELTSLVRGEEFDVFGYDRTRTWARTKIDLPHGVETGWVQLQNDVEGEMARPMVR